MIEAMIAIWWLILAASIVGVGLLVVRVRKASDSFGSIGDFVLFCISIAIAVLASATVCALELATGSW